MSEQKEKLEQDESERFTWDIFGDDPDQETFPVAEEPKGISIPKKK